MKKGKVRVNSKRIGSNLNLELRETTKGITLIALVITIIVLLILAGVTIATLTGENGILTQAQNAKTQTGIGEEKEAIALAYNGAKLEKQGGNITAEDLNDQFDVNKTKAIASEKDEIIVTFSDTKRSYEIDSNGNIEEYIAPVEQPERGGNTFNRTVGTIDIVFLTEKSYNIGQANSPELDSNTMIPINWNGNNWVISDKEHWDYQYDTENRKWANAMLTDGPAYSIDEATKQVKYTKDGTTTVVKTDGTQVINEEDLGSMFVWIPRYAYKIAYFDNETDKQAYVVNRNDASKIVGYSDARGIVDTSGKVPSDITEEQVTGIAVGDNYRPHPTFEKYINKGGWGKKTTGIWVGKFETTTTISAKGTNMILPNKTSQRNLNVSTMFSRAQAIGTSLNMTLDSHMMKNSEWGATAYLAESQYGRNGTEISVNQSSAYITGSGKTIGENNIYESSYYSTPTADQRYNGNIGKLSSTTGNVWGIYDMSGGAFEYVMGFYGTDGTPTTGSTGFTEFPERKYYDLYTSTSANAMNIGATLYEAKGWNNDGASFVNSSDPMFRSGGSFYDTDNAGIFCYYGGNGSSGWSISFRVCLAVK